MDDERYLRDLFAGFAMMGLIISKDYGELSEEAYLVADAMLVARDKKEDYAEEGIAGITKKKYTRKTN
jgi:hypothetical protein